LICLFVRTADSSSSFMSSLPLANCAASEAVAEGSPFAAGFFFFALDFFFPLDELPGGRQQGRTGPHGLTRWLRRTTIGHGWRAKAEGGRSDGRTGFQHRQQARSMPRRWLGRNERCSMEKIKDLKGRRST
jgi:hypothetical protein